MDIDFQFADDIRFWHWWIVALVLLGLEIVVSGTFFVWMGVAAGVAGLLLLFAPEFAWEHQVLVFAILSVVTLVGWRQWLKRHPTKTSDPTLNVRGAQYVGCILKVAEPVVDGIGKAKVGDGLWRISCDETLNLAEGARVRVVGVEGATLTVEHVKD